MRIEESWIPCPDCDSDRVVPATHRNMTPWDSAFARNTHRPGDEVPASKVEAAGQPTDGEASAWIAWAMMRRYND
ncbi:MAG: hypothetical protein ACE5LU_28695 [Anaerolineae bacterium]